MVGRVESEDACWSHGWLYPALLQPIKDKQMKLMLDHTQRLNLHALLGAQRADVGSIRAIWAVQDRIALDTDEEKAIEVRREMIAGQVRVVWNPALRLNAKEFEFTDPEAARIRAADRKSTRLNSSHANI